MGISAAAGALIGTLVTIPIQFIVGKVKRDREREANRRRQRDTKRQI